MVRLEFDLDKTSWTTPAANDEDVQGFRVSAPRASAIRFERITSSHRRSRWLFPGVGTKKPTISENTINKVFATIGYKGRLVGHGTRHTASTLLREHGCPKEHVEAQLAHKEEGISGVYREAQYFGRRVKMMWDSALNVKSFW